MGFSDKDSENLQALRDVLNPESNYPDGGSSLPKPIRVIVFGFVAALLSCFPAIFIQSIDKDLGTIFFLGAIAFGMFLGTQD